MAGVRLGALVSVVGASPLLLVFVLKGCLLAPTASRCTDWSLDDFVLVGGGLILLCVGIFRLTRGVVDQGSDSSDHRGR